jgi:porphobilinogen synthase
MEPVGHFPTIRMRRRRSDASIRAILAETNLSARDLIWPLFVAESPIQSAGISSMPGIYRQTIDQIVDSAHQAIDLGIPAIAIFPYTNPDLRDDQGTEALNPESLVCRTVRKVRAACPDLMIICDVALDPYTSHGHDGLLKDGVILNDETIDVLTQQALLQADAGCDTVAPSDMMDGRIGAIRTALDDAGYFQTRILSYAAKYASCFYGPFREAVGSHTKLIGDKRTYQMNPANSDEALQEVALDLQEGADIVMVKPGMPYLDIIQKVKRNFKVPTFAYQVSGEYTMLQLGIEQGYFDADKAILESLTCFKRAGADAILTYFAPQAAKLLK